MGPYVNRITVFTKPWKRAKLPELASLVGELGFDGVELAVRPGYQVEPETAQDGLLRAVEVFAEAGLRIESVASELTGPMITACARAGVSLLRTMLPLDPELGYRVSVQRFQAQCRELEPFLDGTEVRVGVQNHCGNFVGTACGLMEALAPLPEQFVAVLDLAHTTLAGEPSSYALEICLPRLALLNLKNAVLFPHGRNETGETIWQRRWVSACDGLTSWTEAAELVRRFGYGGPICLTAEYSDREARSLTEEQVLPLIEADLVHLKKLLK